jgi:hypothetical protein
MVSALQEWSSYLKHSNQILLSCHSLSPVTLSLRFISFNATQTIRLIVKEPSNYLKHSNQIRLLLHSILQVTHSIVIPFSLTTANNIQTEGAINLSEALKSNTSLVYLDLSGNSLVVLFSPHSIQRTELVPKEGSNYLKHSNQTQLSLHSISAVTNYCCIWFSLNSGNRIGDEGAIELSEALKSNSSLTSLDISCKMLVASFHSYSIQ